MTRKPSAPARFSRALRTAEQLPAPRDIARRIMQASPGAHNGLRAANYDGKVRGGTSTSHPERVAEERETARPGNELDHLRRLSKASEKAVDAVAALLGECDIGYDPDDYDWWDALKDAHLLTETRHAMIKDEHGNEIPDPDHDPTTCNCLSLLEAAEKVARTIDTHVNRYADAVTDIRLIHLHYTPRASTDWERYKRNGGRADEVCEIHAALSPPMFKPKHGTPQLCKTCADLTRIAGTRPPRDLIRLLEHGTQLEYRKARSRWFDELGVQAESRGA